MKDKKIHFYNSYHAKNRNKVYHSVLSDNNFTYFYTLKYLKKALELIDFIRHRSKSPSASFASIRGDKHETIRVLDLGCGVGTIDFYLAKKGYHVTGIDISAEAINICNQVKKELQFDHTQFIHGDVQTVKFASKFDFILCSEVIEHVEDDRGLLKTIYRLLKPGGVLLLTTPSLNAPLYRLGYLTAFDERVGHLRRYTMESISSLIEESGLEVRERAKAESFIRNSLFTFPPLGYLIKLIRGPFINLFHQFDQQMTTFFGESDLIVLAEKRV